MTGWNITFCILLVLAVSIAQPITVHGDYNIAWDNGTFLVALRINAWQNLTGFQGVSQVFPANMTTSLAGNDLSNFTSSVQQSLQARVSSLTIDQPSVQIGSNAPQNCPSSGASCPVQWLNVTIQFRVHETPTTSTGISRYDLSWKSFVVDSDLQSSGISYNTLGQKYLLTAILPFINFQNGVGRSMSVTIGQLPVTSVTYQTPTRNIMLLDASQLKTPIEKWNIARDISSGSQTWTSPEMGGFNVVGAFRLTESAGSELRLNYIARSQYSAQVVTPLGTTVNRDTLNLDTSGSLWDKIGFSITLLSLGTLVGAVIIDRKVTRISRFRTRNRKR